MSPRQAPQADEMRFAESASQSDRIAYRYLECIRCSLDLIKNSHWSLLMPKL